jgi:hypothetical protein
MKKYYKIFVAVIILSLMITSCVKDLDTRPLNKSILVSTNIFTDSVKCKEALAKLYAGFTISGQQGPSGDADISGIDEGFSEYLREYWYHQVLPTDEAVIAWNDNTVKNFHWQVWTATDQFVFCMYSRIFLVITYCNDFITNANINMNKVTGKSQSDLKRYKAEARFLRALAYYHALDLFGNVPFVTEADGVGSFNPKQIHRADLFNYIEKELIDMQADLADARTNEYARADKAAAWTLLAKLYLNAEVYINKPKYTECITYCNKIIGAGYSLHTNLSAGGKYTPYDEMFLADNNKTCNDEVIFSFTFDGTHSRTFGGMEFLIHGEVGGKMNIADYGIEGGWAGMRVTKAFVQKFPYTINATNDTLFSPDKRAMFFINGQTIDITDITQFTNGYAVTKFKNLTSSGGKPSNIQVGSVDTDWPFFRLADVYLIYAEAVLRNGTGGDASTALGYVNKIIERAYGNNSADINSSQLTLDFILDERARELYWEGDRRTDLIRYGRFSNSTYLWQWKGKVADGVSTDDHLNLYPLPVSDINANPNLKQNPGY